MLNHCLQHITTGARFSDSILLYKLKTKIIKVLFFMCIRVYFFKKPKMGFSGCFIFNTQKRIID